MLLALRSLWEGVTAAADNSFGLARLFYWQREQEMLRRKKRQLQEEEELMTLLSLEL